MDDLEDDGFDEIANVSKRQTPDEAFEAGGNSLPRYNKTGPGSPVKGPRIKKLEDERWGDHLEPHEERDVMHAAQAGDGPALERFYACWHKTLLSVAGDPKFGGPPFDEKLSAARVGLFRALKGFDPKRNNGFYAYAIKFIKGAVCDCLTNWHYKGLKNESREARKDRAGYRPTVYSLDVRVVRDGEDGGAFVDLSVDDHELRECDGSGGAITDADWDRIVAGRAVPTDWCPNHTRRSCVPVPEPCKPISRAIYTEDRVRAYRFDTAAYVQRRMTLDIIKIGESLGIPPECLRIDMDFRRTGDSVPALGIIGYLARKSDKRDRRWLKAMGRRAYASWLERKDWKRAVKYHAAFVPLFARTPMTNCISVNTAQTASDSSDWKSDQDRLEGTAKVQPTVFDEKDKWGWYRSRKDHRPRNEIETANAADADERKDDDSFRQCYPRHQATGVRRIDGNRGGDTHSSSRGGRADVARDAAGAAQGT